jgi:flagellar biosynthesis chaperone FliJ
MKQPQRLSAVERWQSSALEDAKVHMAQLNAVAEEKHTAVARIEHGIASLHALARDHVSDFSLLDAGALLRMNEFQALQNNELQNARRTHEQAAAQADDAQREVLRLFENVSVVQRLIERRQALALQEELRMAQKQLDEGALTRAPKARFDNNGSEDQGHGS